MSGAPPLASGEPSSPPEPAPAGAEAEAPEPAASTAPAGPPPPPAFKPSTFVLTFMFFLGLWMIFDEPTRIEVAGLIGYIFWPLIGFAGMYPLLTMAIAAVLEMLATAIAYNWATDWVKAAKTAKWNAAFRKAQLAALKSGKKDRIEALQPHQQKLTMLSSEVSFAQLKGMAVTWFLVIAIYTWVYLYLEGWPGHHAASAVNSVVLSGSSLGLTHDVWIIPIWFVIFTFYTVPFSLLFRRILKHTTLRRVAAELPEPGSAAVGGAA